MRYHLLLIFTAVLLSCILEPIDACAQSSDCNTAVSVCAESYQENNSPSGTGAVAEFAPGTCQTGGEFNSAWYVFTAQENGVLNFTLTPNDLWDDYDWSLFNITDGGCEGINTGASPELSCNSWGTFSGQPGTTGIGSSQGGSGTSNGPGDANGPPFNSDVQIQQGQVYALVVMNYSSTLNGYSLDFGASTASIFDETPPTISGVDPGCDQSSLVFTLSESVPSDLFTLTNMTIEGNGNSFTPTSLSISSTTINEFALNMPAGFNYTGTATLHFNVPPTDYCGNPLVNDFQFTLDGPFSSTYTTSPACNGENGSLSIAPTGLGNACFLYTVDGVAAPSTECQTSTITDLTPGMHDLVITADSSSCQQAYSVQIENVVVQADLGADRETCSLNWIADADFTGQNFVWQSTGGISFSSSTNPTATVTASSAGAYTLTATTSTGNCSSSDEVIITFNNPPQVNSSSVPVSCFGECDGSLTVSNPTGETMSVTLGNETQTGTSVTFDNLCGGGQNLVVSFSAVCQAIYTPTVGVPPAVEANFTANRYSTTEDDPTFVLTNTSENETAIIWEIAGVTDMFSTSEEWNVTLPAEANVYKVTLTATNDNGCSSQEEKTLTIRAPFAVYIPNSFTPNQDGINEVFAPQFSYEPLQYKLSIFNRYGEEIFSTTDYSQAWTGNHLNGSYYVPEGVYLWKYEAFGYDNEVKQEQGYVVLSR